MQAGYQIRNQTRIYFITFAVVEWVDVFTRKEYAHIVVESLPYCQKEKGFVIYACCLLSNYLHLIISAPEGHALSAILRNYKKFTSSAILKAIENNPQESQRKECFRFFGRRVKRTARIRNTNSGGKITIQ